MTGARGDEVAVAALRTALVVGAGPGGLSAATALAGLGLRVEVVESRDDLSHRGSELMLGGALLRALVVLGAAQGCADRGAPVEASRFFDAAGRPLAQIQLPVIAGDHLPPAIGITRPDLHVAMADAARAAGVRIEVGSEVTAVAPARDGVEAVVGSERRRAALVVAADGVRSPLRRVLCPEAQAPRATGQSVWRARLPTQTDAKAIDIFFGPRSKAGILPTSADTMYLFLVVNHTERPDRTAGPRALGEALEDFGGPVAAAREAIGGPDDVYFGTLETTLMAPPWHRGRVVFVGDAVHATPPHIAYGAGLAIEDGVVLGESLAASQTLSSALERYAERRWERCRLVVHSGLQLGEWEQQPTPEADPAALTERTWRELAAPL